MRRGKDCIALAVWAVGLLLGATELCQAQRLCLEDAVNTRCCTCKRAPPLTLLCLGTCPPGHYPGYEEPSLDRCEKPTTTTTTTTTATTTAAATDSVNSTAANNTDATAHPIVSTVITSSGDGEDIFSNSTDAPASPDYNITCLKCHDACAECTGSGPSNCTTCAEGYEKRNNSSPCVKTPKPDNQDGGGPSVAIIAGAAGGGGAVLIVIVVLVCCLCRRRRRRQHNRLNEGGGPGLMISDLPPALPPQDKEAVEADASPTRQNIAMTYENIPKAPRPISIERGHDKVTRYTKDPTVKRAGLSRPGLERSTTEEKELEELPVAPSLPSGARKRSLQPPQEEYEIVESPGQQQASVQPQRTVTSRPVKHGGKRHVRKSGGWEQKRQTEPGFTLPHPSAPVSLPNLPSQTLPTKAGGKEAVAEAPEDEYINMDGTATSSVHYHARGGLSRSQHAVSDDSDLEDYENTGPRKDVKEDDLEDYENTGPTKADSDLEDYENTGPKGSLLPRDRKGRQEEVMRGFENPVAVQDNEPEEVYGNQDAIVDHERQEEGGEENPYQNIGFTRKT